MTYTDGKEIVSQSSPLEANVSVQEIQKIQNFEWKTYDIGLIDDAFTFRWEDIYDDSISGSLKLRVPDEQRKTNVNSRTE